MARFLPRTTLLAVLALVLGTAAVAPRAASAEDLWLVRSGALDMHFNVALLRELGIDFTADATPGADRDPIGLEVPYWTFPLRVGSDFSFRTEHGVVVPGGLVGGAVGLKGSIAVRDRDSKRSTRFDDLEIVLAPRSPSADGRRRVPTPLQLRSGATKLVFCDLVGSMPDFRSGGSSFQLHYLNARISREWAVSIGRPELAGWVVGFGELRAVATLISSTPAARPPYQPVFADATRRAQAAGGVDSVLDVSLGDLTDIQYIARAGAYPNGLVALSMETTSCNVGQYDVPWIAPMGEDHPVIHMALYRLRDGRFEQVGVSWLKHGFFALSDELCSTCEHPSNGTYLGVGCSDTYSVGNNSNRTYLGPRSEVNPYAGTWECTGSHFSGGVNDCTRRHSSGHGAVDHRLLTTDGDLANPGATYYYEADYVVRGDTLRTNNWGSRRCTMTWNGSVWTFVTPDTGNPLVEGPALGRWGDHRTQVAVAPDDGDVMLAVQTTDLGGGMTHYEYALLNLDSDREIRSFRIPVPGVPNIANIGFHDNDNVAANDWEVTADSAAITWHTKTFAEDSAAHSLVFGYMYNFRFDAGTQPMSVDAQLGPFRPGLDNSDVPVATLGPSGVPVAVGPPARPAARLVDVRPNPFSRSTTISYETLASDARLDIYDAAGRLVRRLVEPGRGSGAQRAVWDGRSDDGVRVRSGVYYANLRAGSFTTVRSIVILN